MSQVQKWCILDANIIMSTSKWENEIRCEKEEIKTDSLEPHSSWYWGGGGGASSLVSDGTAWIPLTVKWIGCTMVLCPQLVPIWCIIHNNKMLVMLDMLLSSRFGPMLSTTPRSYDLYPRIGLQQLTSLSIPWSNLPLAMKSIDPYHLDPLLSVPQLMLPLLSSPP